MSLLVLRNVTLSYGARVILDDVGLRLGTTDRIGLVGPNGSGKTSLMRVLAGEQGIDSGSVERARRSRVGYLPQDLAVAGGRGLLEFVLASVPGRAALDRDLAEAEAELAAANAANAAADGGVSDDAMMELAQRVADIHERIDHFDQFFTAHSALRILAGLGFRPEEQDRDLGELSGGWKMRAVLASLLFQQPELLLLDEPTNHLDMPSVAWLSGFLRRYGRAFILISHDREFLNEQIDRVVSFEPEGLRTYSGNYEQYVKQRAEEEQILEAQARNQAKERERMEAFVERFKAKASKARQAQSRMKQLAKMAPVEVVATRQVMRIRFPEVARTVNDVLRVERLGKHYGDHTVFSGLDLRVQRGERIAIIGPNGAGKTTLLKILAGELAPDTGEVVVGADVNVGYYAQHHADTLHPRATAYQEAARVDPSLPQTRVRSVLGAFLFKGDDVDKLISVLSGGERARVALARLLLVPHSLLLMDEPTNHLDLASAEVLGEALREYGGTLVFVSHSRTLIRTVATQIWNLEGGLLETYAGSLDEYMEAVRARRESPGGDGGPARPDGVVLARTTGGVLPKSPGASPSRSPGAVLAKSPGGAAAGASAGGAVDTTREDPKERRRREAEARALRSKTVGKLEKQVAALEAKIAALEAEQAARGEALSAPETYASAAVRDPLLAAFAAGRAALDALTAEWERAAEELETAQRTLDGEG